ncbi:MAG: hypothetical protein M1812_007622 [Candelaria pacifica]|nr:MAG: hypothetical protein M1812_007622 [Candelaria pacifica]
MKNCLENLTLAITGEFGSARSHENLRRWIKNNGGAFAEQIDDQVTHLICSMDHWKKQHANVKEAMRYPDIKVVSYDWLEDSLHSKRARKETKKYMMKSILTQKRSEKAGKRRAIKEGVKTFQKGCNDAKTDLLSTKKTTDNYHTYHDETGFGYDVVLARADLSKNINERHHLKVLPCPNHLPPSPPPKPPFLPQSKLSMKLFESHAIPHLYCTYTRYSRPGRSAGEDLTPIGSLFSPCFAAFTKFFKTKTGLRWEERLDKKKVEGEVFTYSPPVLGRPRGRMPEGWKEPIEVVDLEEEVDENDGGEGFMKEG